MWSKLLYTLVTVTGPVLVFVVALMFSLVRAADGYTTPHTAVFFSAAGTPSLEVARPRLDGMLSSRLSPEARRDSAFEWYGIKPSARNWMSTLPIHEARGTSWAGVYNAEQRSVMIAQPFLHVFLHEYAHANLHRKSFDEKLRFAVALLRLRGETDPQYAPFRRILEGTMAEARRNGEDYNAVHEFYAYAAQYSGGNLERVPGYLRSFFDDYLTAGPNDWLALQDRAAAQTTSEAEGLRLVRLE